jgi:hypothetical protein
MQNADWFRDTDWFGEIAKRTPFLAVGFILFLIGPTGQVILLNIPVSETGWRIASAIIGILLMGSQVYLIWDAQRLPKTDLPIGQKALNVINRITLLLSNTQKTELIARKDGLELNFEDTAHANWSRRYLLSIDELKQIIERDQIVVAERSNKSPKYGRLRVGRLQKWLYLRSLHPDADKLKQQIITLIQDII